MPRRHKPLKQKQAHIISSPEISKVRYATKQAAERAAKESAKYNIDLELRPYQSPTNGAWYLTSIVLDQTD